MAWVDLFLYNVSGPFKDFKTMAELNLKALLLSPHLDFQQVAHLLSPYGFHELKKADANLQLIADEPRVKQLFSEIIEEFLDCIARSPDPDQALNFFERFAKVTPSKTQLFNYLKASPYTLELLSKLFGSSPFLSEILIRTPTYLYWIANPQTLEQDKAKTALDREASAILHPLRSRERKLEALCLFKRRELLRIGVRDLLKKAPGEETMIALSILAEVLIQKVYALCDQSLQALYGMPRGAIRTQKKAPAAFTILGMGKLGGGELNFSSDVDLLYLYDSEEGKTSGLPGKTRATRISNTEYFIRLSQEITSSLSGMTNEGSLYRVDLRLRPEGKSGEIAYPLKGYLHYYGSRGETWERLALLKAWPIAGSQTLGKRFLKRIIPFIYQQPFLHQQFQEIGNLKERINRKMRVRGQNQLNVKLGTGGIREIEFIVQSLQIAFGNRIPQIRERNTLKILGKLHQYQLLSREFFTHLYDAYIFLRNVEHNLQMVHEFQTHLLPDNPRELRLCALRLGYRDKDNASAPEQFNRDYHLHTTRVNRIFHDLFDSPRTSSVLKFASKHTRQTSLKRLVKK
jgi:glutamate-ammonia-ligase adenylyltransferase